MRVDPCAARSTCAPCAVDDHGAAGSGLPRTRPAARQSSSPGCRARSTPTSMRSTPWTSGLAPEARYELQDCDGMVLGESESHGEAVRMLQAFVLTSPGREEDVFL